MQGSEFQRHSITPSNLICSSLISCIFVFLSQFALVSVPRFFSSSSLLTKLGLSALILVAVTGCCRGCRRLIHVYASAPALVFFNTLFIWGVFCAVVQAAIPPLINLLIHVEFALLMIGLYSILRSDPGVFTYETSCLDELVNSSVSEKILHSKAEELSTSAVCPEQPATVTEENSFPIRRVRYCKRCKAYIKGFDHHCPAFGNCIGQKNHALFMVLLLGFIIIEVSYVVCSTHFIENSQKMGLSGLETCLAGNLVISTMLFSLLQVLWQVVFLIWHIYCICLNIKTDEWINWKKYTEFQLVVQPQPGQTYTELKFRNPYDRGIIGNIKEFLTSKE